MIEEASIAERLLDLTAKRDILLSSQQVLACCTHLRVMLEWNLRVNLTRISEPEAILVKHFLDSMIPAFRLPQSGLALDVGTGPGFPGVPLKILFPGLQMVLLEGVRKKVSFLKVLLSTLAYEGIWALQGRWEEFRRISNPLAAKQYRLITMRGVRLEPAHLKVLAADILEPEGVFAWWAGPSVRLDPNDFVTSLKESNLIFEGEHLYSLPGISLPRRLLTWRRIG